MADIRLQGVGTGGFPAPPDAPGSAALLFDSLRVLDPSGRGPGPLRFLLRVVFHSLVFCSTPFLVFLAVSGSAPE